MIEAWIYLPGSPVKQYLKHIGIIFVTIMVILDSIDSSCTVPSNWTYSSFDWFSCDRTVFLKSGHDMQCQECFPLYALWIGHMMISVRSASLQNLPSFLSATKLEIVSVC